MRTFRSRTKELLFSLIRRREDKMFRGRSEINRDLGRTIPMHDQVRGSAVFSSCRDYRPYLSRGWGPGPTIMWLCMNPSSATDTVDDATSRKLTQHSRRLGFGRLFLLNVMDYRATDPNALPFGQEVSERNLEYIARCARRSDIIVAAYGGLKSRAGWKEYANRAVNACGDVVFSCAATNGDGSPRHPRMFPATVYLEGYHSAANG